MTPTDWEDLVRSSFAAYLTGTVPSSRDAYFEGCWANAGTFGRLDTEQVKATGEPEKKLRRNVFPPGSGSIPSYGTRHRS
jgi:hypothetical protein